jgi:hypothetical protein
MVIAAATPPTIKSLPLVGERRVALQGITWQAYQAILHALPQTRAARSIKIGCMPVWVCRSFGDLMGQYGRFWC